MEEHTGEHTIKHAVPKRIYWIVFATLLILTLITVDIAFYNLGILNNTVAMTIATVKASMVILYFMHVRYSSRLTWLFAIAGFMWLLIFFLFTLADFATRDWERSPAKWESSTQVRP